MPFPACGRRQYLSLIYVSDLVELLCRAADAGRRLPARANGTNGDGYYFACFPEYPDYSQFGRMLRQAVGHRRTVHHQLSGSASLVDRRDADGFAQFTGKPQPLNFDKIREALAESWACSAAAAARDLGFQPAHPLSKRLQTTADWYRDHGWL